MQTIVVGVIGFTGVIMALVLLLLAARHWLVGSGQVKVSFVDNNQPELQAQYGDNLLFILARHNIRIPSACGGKGSCGACRLKIIDGGDVLSPLEAAIISPRDAKHNFRLACQLKLKQDVKIVLPPSVFVSQEIECQVVSNQFIASFIKELIIKLPPGNNFTFQAGDYVQLSCPAYHFKFHELSVPAKWRSRWQQAKLFDCYSSSQQATHRSYSVANYPDQDCRLNDNILTFDIRLATPPEAQPELPPGVVSSYLFSLKPGDKLKICGPFGQMHAKTHPTEMVMIGGGVGMAPLRSIIFDQLVNRKNTHKISYWYGARSLTEAFYQGEFEQLAAKYDNFSWTLALSSPQPEDNWHGATGFIHQVFCDGYLASHPAPEDVDYYLCGPPPMVNACVKLLDEYGVDQQNIFVDQFG